MPKADLNKQIEEKFRSLTSSGELFDTFQDALKNNITDPDIYKILLANPNLTSEEIMMYTEKLAKEFRHFEYDYYMWTAQVFENNLFDLNSIENSFNYYVKANSCKPTESEPLLRILGLYNYDLYLPLNEKIVSTVETLLSKVNLKSRVYFALAEHFKRLGNFELEKKYLRLAEKSLKKE
ncbi:hypothetical protein ABRY23_10665 [Melioribacteraceae bacterium 4301-Me]|uniref:hypothetical protein n=1 Tax=Pyranulibacter aquaticus TaxID=3163344 RepID=UPI003597E18B